MARDIEIKTPVFEITLRNGEKTLVDEEDYHTHNQYVWSKHSAGYAVRSVGNAEKGTYKQYLLHREVLDVPDGKFVDHINGNKLDNRKSNLRVCSSKENVWSGGPNKVSTSPYKGVSWYKPTKNWTARIGLDGTRFYLGRFATEESAARAYDEKAFEYYGEYAYLNFPEEYGVVRERYRD